MVPPSSNRISRVPPYSRTALHPYPYRAVTVSGAPFQALPVRAGAATGLVRVRSPLLAESRLMSFPPATEMVQFAGFASCSYGFTTGYRRSGGLPHSEIRGSTGARPSPRLFAACHVLHRLSVPRHPPDALLSSSPTLSPKRARPENRGQRSEDRWDTTHQSRCLPSAPPVRCALEPRHKPSLRRGSRPGVFAYPCPGPARRNGWTCFTVTTRFTMSEIRDQRSEIRGQMASSPA